MRHLEWLFLFQLLYNSCTSTDIEELRRKDMKIMVYQSEFDKEIPLEFVGKVKYHGETFLDGFTDGKIYSVVHQENGDLAVVDDSEEDYLYSFANPAPADGSSPGGIFEIISDDNGEIQREIDLEKRWL